MEVSDLKRIWSIQEESSISEMNNYFNNIGGCNVEGRPSQSMLHA